MGRFREFFRGKPINEGGVAIVKTGGNGIFGLAEEDKTQQRSALLSIYKQAYDQVPLVTAIIDVQADQTVQEFFFEGKNKEKLTEWGDKVNLMQFFHRTAKIMLLYGDSFSEAVGNDELKMLDPIWMVVYRKNTGEITGYAQIMNDKHLVLWGTTGDEQTDLKFKKKIRSIDSIIHFKHNVLNSEKYGRSVIHSLIQPINIKLDMENNLRKIIFKYVAPLIWAKVGNDQFPANTDIVDTISSTLRDLSAESEITTSHLVELGVLAFNAKGMDIKTPLEHVEQQIITGGQVPPVLLGRQSSGKADAEVQLRAFGRHIKANQRELKNEFEDQIIVGQGIGSEEDKLVWTQAEEREREIEIDILRGLVTDGILTPQKANDLLPPKFNEKLPEPDPMMGLLNGQEQGEGGVQKPRANQMKADKVKDNPNDPTMKKKGGRRRNKTDKEIPVK